MKKPLKKLRITVLIDAWFPFYGGGQVHVRETVRILRKKYNCNIVIFHGFSPILLLRIIWNFFVIIQVLLVHIRKPFDLIHAHAYSAGISGKILSSILKIPVVFTVHGANNLDLKRKGLKSWLEKLILTKIKYDCEISVSSSFLEHKNVNKNIKVIGNGVNLEKFQAAGGKRSNLATCSLRLVAKLLFVGRLEKVKGIDVLLKALAKIKNKLPEFELKIVGEGNLRKELEELMHRLDLCKQVKFLGRKTGRGLVEEYQKADLFILPSLSEGQPLTLLEAWAVKLPVLVTRVGDNPKMVKEGKNGFLVKAGNVQDLGYGLQKAFRMREKWKEIGERGYKLVCKNYTWQETAKKIYKVYKEQCFFQKF